LTDALSPGADNPEQFWIAALVEVVAAGAAS
jgi:hypothetical protein